MSSFDYNAPAELFLAKPMKGSRTKYRRFATAAEALRYAVEDYAYAASLRRLACRLEMSASTASKSNACTKPMSIRCASLSERSVLRIATGLMGPPPGADFRDSTPTTDFKEEPERATAPDQSGVVSAPALALFLSISSSARLGSAERSQG